MSMILSATIAYTRCLTSCIGWALGDALNVLLQQLEGTDAYGEKECRELMRSKTRWYRRCAVGFSVGHIASNTGSWLIVTLSRTLKYQNFEFPNIDAQLYFYISLETTQRWQ